MPPGSPTTSTGSKPLTRTATMNLETPDDSPRAERYSPPTSCTSRRTPEAAKVHEHSAVLSGRAPRKSWRSSGRPSPALVTRSGHDVGPKRQLVRGARSSRPPRSGPIAHSPPQQRSSSEAVRFLPRPWRCGSTPGRSPCASHRHRRCAT